MKRFAGVAAFVWVLVLTQPGWAYVGPGAGLSLLGALWGVGIAIVAALGFVILWPLRRLLRSRRTAPPEKTEEQAARPEEASGP